jgi:hypothetical protein
MPRQEYERENNPRNISLMIGSSKIELSSRTTGLLSGLHTGRQFSRFETEPAMLDRQSGI